MLHLDYKVKRWPMREPFVIADKRYEHLDVVHVTITDAAGKVGRAETCGVDYKGETVDSICDMLGHFRADIEAGTDRVSLLTLMPAGGARNGVDCALWDLAYAVTGRPAFRVAHIEDRPTTRTVFTIGVVGAERARHLAGEHAHFQTIKIKADKTGSLETIRAVRDVCPDAKLIVDANRSWSEGLFNEIEPELRRACVDVLEQPFPVGEDLLLEAYAGPLMLAADESAQTTGDLGALKGKYDVINIKLDKTGGLTEAVRMARHAERLGFRLMVGNMCGSSLAMAPAFVLAQLCDFVDLDGPLLQAEDVPDGLVFKGDRIVPGKDRALWGGI